MTSTGRDQQGHSTLQHSPSSGEFINAKRNGYLIVYIGPPLCYVIGSHLPHIPEYLSISSGAIEDVSDSCKKLDLMYSLFG